MIQADPVTPEPTPMTNVDAGASLTLVAHPCEGPGSDPQDVLPDDRAWGSRTPPPIRP